jgi:hypothetical protein
VVVLAIVAVACFVAGIWGATKWLPPLADGPVESLVYFVVCGLAGAVLVVFGVHIWQIVRELERERFVASEVFVADDLMGTLWQSGTLAALALIPYLLARKGERISSPG